MRRQRLAVPDKVPDLLGRLLHVVWRLVLIRSVLQHPFLQHVVLEISRIKLANESAVHIECRNAVLLLDEVRRGGVGHIFNIFLQNSHCFTGIPKRQIVLG